jgi:hypothetical protein
VRGAGTNAKVFMELYGEDGSSGERRLENSQDNFERKKTDVFAFDCVDLGPLKVKTFVFFAFCVLFTTLFFATHSD